MASKVFTLQITATLNPKRYGISGAAIHFTTLNPKRYGISGAAIHFT